MLSIAHIRSTLLRAVVGALLGAVIAATGFLTLPRWSPSLASLVVELPFWLLAMALTFLPVTVLSAVCTRVALERLPSRSLVSALGTATALAVISPFAYGWYMTEVAPATNWWRGWWVPAAASALTVIIEAGAIRRGLKTAEA